MWSNMDIDSKPYSPHLWHSSSVLVVWSKVEVPHRMASSVPLSMTAPKDSDGICGIDLRTMG